MAEEEKYLFKIWNAQRTKKTMIVLNASDAKGGELYNRLILKANEKLCIDGSSIVLETDGTVVDEDDVLILVKNQTLMLLQRNEIWFSADAHNNNKNTASTCDTVSNQSFSSNNSLINIEELPVIEMTELFPNADTLLSNKNTCLTNEKSSNLSNELSKTVNENMWRQFVVPWEKLPENILTDLRAGVKNKYLSKTVIHFIINEMRVLKKDFSSKIFKIVAHKIIDQFPQSFKDVDDDGVVLGDGSHTIFKKLEDRNSYLNTCVKRKNPDIKGERAHNKRKISSKAGCVEWDPPQVTDSDINIDHIQTRKCLEDESLKPQFLETYAAQRFFLNQSEPPSVEQIKKDWPVLLTEKGIFWHYEKLMSSNVDELELNLKKKSKKIICYAELKKKLKNSRNNDKATNDEDTCIEALKTISILLKENFEDILYTLSDEEENLELIIKSLSPCIVCFGDGELKKYHVIIEKKYINNGTSCFFNSLKQCYACFYNFNMTYPKSVSATWEFIQRYFLKCHPDIGTKSQTYLNSKKKVIALMKNLADFDLESAEVKI